MPGVPVTEDRSHPRLRPLPGGGHAVHITALPTSVLIRYREELIAVAAQAFGSPPWTEAPVDAVRVIDRMWCNLGRRDFIAVAALDGPHLAGFAYGHTDTTIAGMIPALVLEREAFELVELAVATAYQGQGIGRALHDALLAEAPTSRLLLTHPAAPARDRYRRWGWTELGTAVSARSGENLVVMRHDGAARIDT